MDEMLWMCARKTKSYLLSLAIIHFSWGPVGSSAPEHAPSSTHDRAKSGQDDKDPGTVFTSIVATSQTTRHRTLTFSLEN